MYMQMISRALYLKTLDILIWYNAKYVEPLFVWLFLYILCQNLFLIAFLKISFTQNEKKFPMIIIMNNKYCVLLTFHGSIIIHFKKNLIDIKNTKY